MTRPERKLVGRIKFALSVAVTWFLLNMTGEQLGAAASASWFGRTIGPILTPLATIVVVVGGIGWLALAIVERVRSQPDEIEERQPPPITPLAWYAPERLFGRRNEVEQAFERVMQSGVVLVAGVRDVGTSMVAEHVTQRLIETHHLDEHRILRFDLRSRSTSEPYDAAATAGRIMAAFDIEAPSDNTDEVLARAADRLREKLPGRGDILFLDNVSTAEQVAWLVQRWPAGGWPRLVVAGETAVGDAAGRRTVPVDELPLVHMREIWDSELDAPEQVRRRVVDLLRRLRFRTPGDDPVDELLRACVGRPRAVITLAQEIRRLSDAATAEEHVQRLLTELHAEGPVAGPLERVWTAILDNIWEGLTDDASWLLRALVEQPVTGLTRGAIAAILDAGRRLPSDRDPEPLLKELRLRNLVQEQGGRYRVPQEIRRAIERTGYPDRHEVVACAVPALERYFARYVEEWAGRLDVDTEDASTWFRTSEPSFRPLFEKDRHGDGELLKLVFADLCSIADGLDSWYVREQQSVGMLEVNEGLHELALRSRREDVAALAATRVAAAHRLARRFGEAAHWLDTAERHAESTDDRHRAELETRVQVERALLTASGPEPDAEAIRDAMAGLTALRAVGRKVPGHAVILVNLAVLAIQLGQTAEAKECAREAEKVARDARDAGSEAHSVELQGTALAAEAQPIAAVRCWQRARTDYGRIGERLGEARCLLNLGAMALTDVRMAGQLRYGRPMELSKREAAEVALPLLERAKVLRSGQPDIGLIDHHLARARRELDR